MRSTFILFSISSWVLSGWDVGDVWTLFSLFLLCTNWVKFQKMFYLLGPSTVKVKTERKLDSRKKCKACLHGHKPQTRLTIKLHVRKVCQKSFLSYPSYCSQYGLWKEVFYNSFCVPPAGPVIFSPVVFISKPSHNNTKSTLEASLSENWAHRRCRTWLYCRENS